MKKKLLYFFHVIYVFKKVALKTKLLRLHHDDFFANHFEIKKIRVLMQKKFYWLKMTRNVKEYVKNCDMCQRIKTSRHCFYDELSSFSVLTRSWAKISMNFIMNFFKSLWWRHLRCNSDYNRSFFEKNALHIRKVNVIDREFDRRSFW